MRDEFEIENGCFNLNKRTGLDFCILLREKKELKLIIKFGMLTFIAKYLFI